MNGYERLRQRISQLEKEYDELFKKFEKVVENPDSEESKEIKSWLKYQGFLRIRFNMYSITSLLTTLSDAKPSNIFSWLTLDRERTTKTEAP